MAAEIKKSKEKKLNLKKNKNLKKWLSGLRRQTVNLLSKSHQRFESFFLQKISSKYNAAVACLLWEQEAVCSNHTISKKFLNFK